LLTRVFVILNKPAALNFLAMLAFLATTMAV
jgi:hypothetical protein